MQINLCIKQKNSENNHKQKKLTQLYKKFYVPLKVNHNHIYMKNHKKYNILFISKYLTYNCKSNVCGFE